MNRGENTRLEEMRTLIYESCQFEKNPNDDFKKFHKVFLKFSFDAVDVKIDYGVKEIYISNCKPLTTNPVRLFNMKEAVADKFSYTDLEETLAGCLKSGPLQNRFYKILLDEYWDNSKIKYA